MSKKHYLLILVLLTNGCASLLPKANTDSAGFKSFDDAKAAFETLEPMKSRRSALEKSGFDPARHPNTFILTHADVVRRFVPSALLVREDLDPGILVCLKARDTCRGLEINVAKVARVRTGNFFADFFNFKRRTETTGWRFNATVLLVDDLVVYRTWGGQPVIQETELTRNPLGPLQDIGPATVNTNKGF